MPLGKENQLLREQMLGYVNRKNGNMTGIVTESDVEFMNAALHSVSMGVFTADDGTILKVQDDNGALPYVAGLDGPAF